MTNIEKAKQQIKRAQAKLRKAELTEKRNARKARDHGLYCLAGALLKFKPETVDELLAVLAVNNAPAGHLTAIQFVSAKRDEVLAELDAVK